MDVNLADINIDDFNYPLTEDKIAKFPLAERDASSLLVLKNGRIGESTFRSIADFLPGDSLLVFNETKVIQARLIFEKNTGARIEIFCLEPIDFSDYQLAFQQKKQIQWKCFVGNSKRWKSGRLKLNLNIGGHDIQLLAERLNQSDEASVVEFSWNEEVTFGEILENTGHTPIPPYLKRNSVESDKERYQTLYARNEGSVAAPTAGLHFTETVLDHIRKKGIQVAKLNLHVGAGTFKPVISQNITDHVMHFEKIRIGKELIGQLIDYADKSVIAVGTTSVRTLESMYWHGLKCMEANSLQPEINTRQWDPYQYANQQLPSSKEIFEFLMQKMNEMGIDELSGSTQLMILPSYQYRIISGMITNFHQPKSTLLLLVSAFIGNKWKEVYQYALERDFRFLSYGDSCLFLPD